jgi:putative nucleotidyltransferase with HDIG domain
VGQLDTSSDVDTSVGVAAARQLYDTAVKNAEVLWATAKADDKPNPAAARSLIDSLATLGKQDRNSLMALTALKRHDNYTFTHMVNVSVLTMALARSLNIQGSLLREFGVAALMHDIGKVKLPSEILEKPDALTPAEFTLMKRHVIDGAHILRVTPEMPALAPLVAFEHHLRQDLSGYPEHISPRKLNLCTMIVSIADVYDALRSNRVYRRAMPTDRVRAIMAERTSPAFNQTLLRRFINLIGLFPVGTLVRLNTDEIGVVVHEHPSDPFRPQVKVVRDSKGEPLEEPLLVSTWEPDARGDYPRAAVEAVEERTAGIDPAAYL